MSRLDCRKKFWCVGQEHICIREKNHIDKCACHCGRSDTGQVFERD